MTEPRAENINGLDQSRKINGRKRIYWARISYKVNDQRKQYNKSFSHTKQGKKDAIFWVQQEKAKLKQNSNRNLTIKDLMDLSLIHI